MLTCVCASGRSLKVYYLYADRATIRSRNLPFFVVDRNVVPTHLSLCYQSPYQPFPLPAIMANVSSRKKSIASNAGLVIDTPVASNSILNKAASQFTSLYQQCASLRSRLMRIPGFPAFFALLHQNGSPTSHPDPVDEIWDCFSLGISLCFLLNLLPSQRTPIGIDTNPATFAIHNTHARKRAIAHFVMGIRQMENCEEFSVTELLDRKSKDGLVKVCDFISVDSSFVDAVDF